MWVLVCLLILFLAEGLEVIAFLNQQKMCHNTQMCVSVCIFLIGLKVYLM